MRGYICIPYERKGEKMQQRTRAVMIGLALAALTGTVTARADTVEAKTRFVISANGLNLRRSCSTKDDTLAVMEYGDAVIEEFTIGIGGTVWSKLEYEGLTGYARTEYLSDEAPRDRRQYLGRWLITAYAYTGSPCANGNYPQAGYTIACNSLPFGTQVYIDGVGIRTVEDTDGGAMGDEWIDLYMGDTASCMQWGSQYRDVYLVEE